MKNQPQEQGQLFGNIRKPAKVTSYRKVIAGRRLPSRKNMERVARFTGPSLQNFSKK